MKITNEITGQEITLTRTNDIKKLESQIFLLGMNGLFYSSYSRRIQNKIDELKEKKS